MRVTYYVASIWQDPKREQLVLPRLQCMHTGKSVGGCTNGCDSLFPDLLVIAQMSLDRFERWLALVGAVHHLLQLVGEGCGCLDRGIATST